MTWLSGQRAGWGLLLVLAACQKTPGRSAFDEDGDGALSVGDDPALIDCDDHDAQRSPLILEDRCAETLGRRLSPGDDCVALAYDGIDNDCDGFDWVDIDDDGVPAVTSSAYEDATGTAWPEDRVIPVHDPARIDCNDFSARVSPHNAEVYYDGVDDACDAGDDFDADGDGYSRVPQGDDCDDTDAAIWPGNPADAWYDGVDSDCAGNDDFDQDGDGYTPEEGDCLDADVGGLLGASMHPGAFDLPYDGIDADCAGDDDFDADSDGYELGDDCDDVDPDVHPGGFESLGDLADGDCDGMPDGSAFTTHDLGWDEPHSVFVGRTNDYYAITTSAEYLDDLTTGWTRAGVTLYFDRTNAVNSAATALSPFLPPPWWPAGAMGLVSPPISSGVSAAQNNDSLYVATSFTSSSAGDPDMGFLLVRRGTFTAATPVYGTSQSVGSTLVTAPFADIDLRTADGYVWAWGCGDGTAGLLVSEDSSSAKLLNRGDAVRAATGIDADTAVLEPGPSGSLTATGLCCGAGSCQQFQITEDAVAKTAKISKVGAATSSFLAENSNGDWMASVSSSGVVITSIDGLSYTVLAGYTVTDAAIATDGPTFFVLGATATGLVLGYGIDPLALTVVSMPFSDGVDTWVPDKVGIYADSDRIILAATTRDGTALTDTSTSPPKGAVDPDDHVGWLFLGRGF
jgi:hypothetical protein